MNKEMMERLQAKTPEQRFLNVLIQEFQQPPRVAQAMLEEAQTCLLGQAEALRPGQIRVVLARLEARPGQAVRQMATQEVTWTIDAGREDRQVEQAQGSVALRQVRIQRLLDEALEQGAVATQEDLAYALHVSVRTIKRDCKVLSAQGLYLPTRGNLQGVGRGQTHKAQIVGCWLRGATYDQITLHTHHSLSSVQRYVQSFVRVVDLHQQGYSENDIALVLELSPYLVRDYLSIYQAHDADEYRERLTEQLARLRQAPQAKKGGR